VRDLRAINWVIRETGSGTRRRLEELAVREGLSLDDLNIAFDQTDIHHACHDGVLYLIGMANQDIKARAEDWRPENPRGGEADCCFSQPAVLDARGPLQGRS
jgi:hypothetical protein